MRLLPLVSAILPLVTSALSAPELGITTTNQVTCARKTVEGDTVQMHYRGRLQGSDEEFDASYNRGSPLSFKVGAGWVIKGWESRSSAGYFVNAN